MQNFQHTPVCLSECDEIALPPGDQDPVLVDDLAPGNGAR